MVLSEGAIRGVAATMASANLVAMVLILLWERPGREATLLMPARWRTPRLGTVLMYTPLVYPAVVVVAPGWLTWQTSLVLHGFGVAVWATGLAVVVWCVRELHGLTGADGIVVGHRLMTSGPYRLVRHPMYGAALVTTIGSALAFGSYVLVFVALVLLPILNSWATTEDRLLASSELGSQYTGYARRAGRMLPRFRRH